MVSPFVALAGALFVLVGAVFLYFGGPLAVGLLRRRLQRRTVEATVVESAVTEREDGRFEPTVRFRYRFDGRDYESTLVREGEDPPTGPRELAESFLEDYPEGETVTATLLTSTPDQAVLERGSVRWLVVVAGATTVVGTAFALIGAGVVVGALLG